MKLRIRKGIFSWSLVNENGTTVAKISNQKLMGAAKKISDAKGKVIFTTDIVNLPVKKKDWNYADTRKYIIYKDGEPVAIANLSLDENPERTKAFILRPPQVGKMNVETPYGIWIIQRQKNNSLTITHDEVQLASVTPFFIFKPIYLEFTEKYEISFWAGIYMLIEYMMHEDDLIVV
mgnify:FL=1